MSMVRFKQGELPPLTKERKEELKALASRPDSEINYDDMPQLTDEFWSYATPNPYYKPIKTPASVRLDADLFVWLKSHGRGYQAKMNDILRAAMMQTHPKARKHVKN